MDPQDYNGVPLQICLIVCPIRKRDLGGAASLARGLAIGQSGKQSLRLILEVNDFLMHTSVEEYSSYTIRGISKTGRAGEEQRNIR